MGTSASWQIEHFEYPGDPAAPSLRAWDACAMGVAAPRPEDPARDPARQGAVEGGLRAEFEKRLAEETRRAFEGGRERGRLEGRQAEHEAQAAATVGAEERRMRQAAELIKNFAVERDRYLQAVEHDVVALALAVAARILRREAQMDPLLLTGAVRVALGQLTASTQVRLRVPAADLELWSETIRLLPNLTAKPDVVAGEGLRLGECQIETEMGSVDLGIRAQLAEIERGFFDRVGGSRVEACSERDQAASGREAGL